MVANDGTPMTVCPPSPTDDSSVYDGESLFDEYNYLKQRRFFVTTAHTETAPPLSPLNDDAIVSAPFYISYYLLNINWTG